MAQSVLIITHEYLPYPGGIGRYCASLARASVQAGFAVDVIAPDYGQAVHDDDFAGSGVKVHRFPGDTFRLAQLRTYRQLIRDQLSARRYDCILAADWPAILALGAVKTPGCQRLATIYGTDVLMFEKSLRLWLSGASRGLRSCDRLVCISDFTRSLVSRIYPTLAGKTDVVPLGVDEQWFSMPDASAIETFRGRIGREARDLIILTVARLDSRKGHDQTIAALALLPDALKRRLKYVCVGRTVDTEYCDRLRVLAGASGLRLVVTGAIPDAEVLAAYHEADVFALTANAQPRKVEGFGLVLLEAAAQGLPSVVTPVDAIPEVINSGLTGFIAASPQSLATAFETLLSSDRSLWRAGCINHARRFTWDACARATFAGLMPGSESPESGTKVNR